MIAQLRDTAGEFQRRGVQLLIVEPNDAYRIRYVSRRARRNAKDRSSRPIDEFTAGMGAWLGKSGKQELTVVTDPTATAAASYGVAMSGKFNVGGELFHRPATFLIDREGVIRFMADYRDTEPLAAKELLAVLDDLEEKRAFITALKDKRADLRDALELVLQPTRPEAATAVPALSRALGDEDAEVRAGAAAALGWLGYRAAPGVLRLGQALADRDPRVRYLSGDGLARIGPAASPAVPSLIRAMKEADAQVRVALEQVLMESPRRAQFVFPSIAAKIELPYDAIRIRGAAISALERIGPQAAAGLIEAIKDPDSGARMNVVGVLGRFQGDSERVGPALGKVLRHDKEARIRESAANALNRLRHFDLALVAALKDEDAVVRAAATSALERTGGVGHWEAVLALVAALADADPRVREGAFYALDHRADGTVPTLVAALQSNDPQVRLRAAEIMGLLWDKAEELQGGRLKTGLRDEAAPVLRKALQDKDARVRRAAAAALAKINASPSAQKSK